MNPVGGLKQGGVFGPAYLWRAAIYTFQTTYQLVLSEIHLNAASVRAQAKSRTQEQLLTMDVLVLATMKNAAKCDT